MKHKKSIGKKVNFELITRDEVCGQEPYKLLDEIRRKYHEHLADAEIAVAWRKETKPDKDGHVVLGRCVKVAGLYREMLEYDFVIVLNREAWNLGFSVEQKTALIDHELCFPGEVLVTGPEVELGMRRRYSGKMVEIITAAGHKLAGTPNHPILTDQGWVPLGLLNEGHYVVSSRDPERVSAAMNPHKYQTPSCIKDVVGSVPMVAGLVPEAAHNLDSDLADGEIEVVRPDRGLLLALVSSLAEHIHQLNLGWRGAVEVGMASLRHLDQGIGRVLLASPGDVGIAQLSDALGMAEFSHPVALGIRRISDRDTGFNEKSFKGGHAIPEGLFERLQGRSSGVRMDEIVKFRTFQHDEMAHVYNLQTSQQWYHANGVVVHNCHAEVQYDDETGEVKVDELGRKCYRLRKHDIEEFQAIVQRHGCYKRDLERFAEVLMKKAKNPLFAEQAKAEGKNAPAVN